MPLLPIWASAMPGAEPDAILHRRLPLLLRELSQARGVSGQETAVRELILSAIKDRVDEYRTDALGNLMVLKRGTGATRRRVMVSAHMDEVGLMIVQIEREGWLRFRPVGGLDDRVLLAKKVLIGEKAVAGVIGVKPIHLLDERSRQQVIRVEELTIDIGATGRDDASHQVTLGDYVSFDTAFVELGGSLRTVRGKAFDDRAGCAVLVELLQGQYPCDLCAVFTVQEEVGLRGATVAAYSVKPDLAYALEGTSCDELPRKADTSSITKLGDGPAVTVMDRSVICDPRLVDLLVDTAQRHSIPCQFKQPLVGGTDAGAIHRSREGVPTAVVSVPARYIHAPVSLMSMQDLDSTVHLMKETLNRSNDIDLSRPV
jgi:tetrahedral aminopeptidase